MALKNKKQKLVFYISKKTNLILAIYAYKEEEHFYGLIFMDCSMPIMDGYTAADKIRKFMKNAKSIHNFLNLSIFSSL
jgi:CheY-like chemotaxis protein